MNNLNEKLSEALEIQPLEFKQSTEIVEIKDVVDDDAEFARQNIRDLIVKGNDAASHIVEIAKQSEHPRAFEVVGNMIKQLADVNQQLLDLHKQQADVGRIQKTETKTVNNNVFIGSTNELNKIIKNYKETEGE